MNETVLCKDCKHSFRTWGDLILHGFRSPHAYKCRKVYKKNVVEEDRVIGNKIKPAYFESCGLVRCHDASYKNNCGKEGLWWEPKDNKKFFMYLKRI